MIIQYRTRLTDLLSRRPTGRRVFLLATNPASNPPLGHAAPRRTSKTQSAKANETFKMQSIEVNKTAKRESTRTDKTAKRESARADQTPKTQSMPTSRKKCIQKLKRSENLIYCTWKKMDKNGRAHAAHRHLENITRGGST